MDRLTGIGVFVAAVEEGSLAGAARRFGLSAAMAGKYVGAIETELNARLLQRTTRRLGLTDIGQVYYARCKRLLEDWDEANREASDAQGAVRGTLRVAAPVAFGALHLGGAVARFLEAHPQVEVEVQLSDRYVDLLDAGVDVAVRIGRLPDSDLVARRLAPCRMVIAAAPAWLARHGTPRHPAELRRAPRLTFSEAVSAGDWTLADANGTVEIVNGPSRLAANNVQMLLAAARAGAGVVFGPSFVLGEAIARGELVELLPDWRAPDLTIQAVYPSARHLPLKVRRFVDCLAAEFGDAPPWDRYREPAGKPTHRRTPPRG